MISSVSRPRKVAILLAATLTAMMLSVGPAAGEAAAMGEPYWEPYWELDCAVAEAGDVIAIAC